MSEAMSQNQPTAERTPSVPDDQQCTIPGCPEPKADDRGRGGLCGAHLNGETPASMQDQDQDTDDESEELLATNGEEAGQPTSEDVEAADESEDSDRTLPDGWTFSDRVPDSGLVEKPNPTSHKPTLWCPHCCAAYTRRDKAEDHERTCTGIPYYALGQEGRFQQKRRWMASVGYPVDPHKPDTKAGRRAPQPETHRPPRAVDAEMATTRTELDEILDDELDREDGPRKTVVSVINQKRAEFDERVAEMGLGDDGVGDSEGGTDRRDLSEPKFRSPNGRGVEAVSGGHNG